MKLILHIGTEKTGSSSLQLTLAHQRQALAAQGLWYSQVFGKYAHRKLSLYGRDYDNVATDNRLADHGVESQEHYQSFCETIEAELRDDVEAARQQNCRYFIVSCEYFSSLYRNAHETTRLAALLRPHFDDIEVVCFIRPQLDVLISRVSTLACDGIEINEEGILDLATDEQYFDFDAMLDRWAAGFGPETIRPVPYKRNKDTLTYMSALTNVDIPEIGLERINQSIDAESIALLNAAKLTGATLESVSTYLKDFGARSKLSLSRAGRKALQERFEECNRALLEKWPSLTDDDLRSGDANRGDDGNAHLLSSADRFAPQLKYVFERYQNEIARDERSHAFVRSRDITLVLPQGHFAGQYLLSGGLFRPHVIPLFERILQEGQVVVDVGANVGFFSLMAAKRIGWSGRALAFEPSAKALAALMHATSVNAAANVEIFNTALYDCFCTLAVTNNFESTNCVLRNPDAVETDHTDYSRLQLVSAIPADQVLRDLPRCDIVKIAVGGNEYPALRGAAQTLDRFKPLVISEYSPDYQADVARNTPDAYWELFAALGYRCHLVLADGQLEAVPDLAHLLARYEEEKRRCGGVTHFDLCFEHPAGSVRVH